MFCLIFMIIVHLNNQLTYFSQKQNNSMSVLIKIRYKNTSHTLHISIEIYLMFLI